MSKLSEKPILIPEGVKVMVEDNKITVEGPKGVLSREVDSQININLDEGSITLRRLAEEKETQSLHGLTRTLILNMIEGVTKGFQKELELLGVGYRAQKTGDELVLQLGFSYPVKVKVVAGIDLEVEGSNKIRVSGIDKELVGRVAASIRAIKPPEPYKGKGIKYTDEIIRKKPGKAGKIAQQ